MLLSLCPFLVPISVFLNRIEKKRYDEKKAVYKHYDLKAVNLLKPAFHMYCKMNYKDQILTFFDLSLF